MTHTVKYTNGDHVIEATFTDVITQNDETMGNIAWSFSSDEARTAFERDAFFVYTPLGGFTGYHALGSMSRLAMIGYALADKGWATEIEGDYSVPPPIEQRIPGDVY